MPEMRAEVWQLGLLLLCVPVQFFIAQYWSLAQNNRSFALKELLAGLGGFYQHHLTWESWREWGLDWLARLMRKGKKGSDRWRYEEDPQMDPMGESPAVEVMRYKHKEGHFATSPESRTFRSPEVQFRVGQVVTHNIWKYRGVIIGWDHRAKAPDEWLAEMHGRVHQNWRKMPNYAVLVDTRDRLSPQINYVPQENITPVKNTKVMHPLLEDFFEKFDGAQYIPRPWLRALYPRD